jgi:hypothetical protein
MALEVLPAPTSLISLSSGRPLSPFTDGQGRIRLFYEARRQPQVPCWRATPLTPPPPCNAGYATKRSSTGRVRFAPDRAVRIPQGDLAALAPDDRIYVAWIDDPQTARSPASPRYLARRPARLGIAVSFTLTDDAVRAQTWSPPMSIATPFTRQTSRTSLTLPRLRWWAQ